MPPNTQGTIIQKFGVTNIYIFNSFILQGCIKVIKCDSKNIYIVEKWSDELWTLHQRNKLQVIFNSVSE